MKTSLLGAILLLSLVPAAPFSSQQAPQKVSFRDDVLPLLKEQCVGCHGPSQQMNGLRLDRRSAAMRGGTITVLVPGSSGMSRLYLKLVGTQYGQQMPPTGRLSEREIEILKTWIDQGAEWPDDLAGELAPRPPDPSATRLMEALRRGDTAMFGRELARNGSVANAMGPAGSTPLMYAVLYGDIDSARRLLQAGADPNATSAAGTTALMWAVGDAEKTRLLLDRGARPDARADDGRAPLIIAASQFGSGKVVKLLLDHGALATTAASNRTTALRQAAVTGDLEVMRLLIDAGADLKGDAAAVLPQALLARCRPCADMVLPHVDRRGISAALVTLARWGDVDAVRLLLDHGADVNARDADGRTVLMLASNSDTLSLDVVRMLIARGADVNAQTPSGDTASGFAALRGGAIAQELANAGTARPPASRAETGPPRSNHPVAVAVQRSVALLQKADVTFLRKSGCVSCHNNSLTAMTVALARKHKLTVDEHVATAQLNKISTYLESWRESALRGVGIPGAQDTVSYILVGMGAEQHPSDPATDAMAYYLKARQQPDGHWRIGTHRPPIESSDVEVTAMSLRALRLYAPRPQRAEYEASVRLAAQWLASARPATTEDRAFQLLGLRWAGGDANTIARAAQVLLAEQRSDGGWAPLSTAPMESDAYATGQTLVALREAGGLTVSAPAYQRGVRFLLDTQAGDGSWYVKTRALPIQPYFESDFPYGGDQWISAAATNWATMALIPVSKPQ
jgi:ankyrin repeat protein